MKTRLAIVSTFFAVAIGCVASSKQISSPPMIIERWSSGIVQETLEVLPEGNLRAYFYDNGQLKFKAIREKSGGFHGRVLAFYKSGAPLEESFWQRGKIMSGRYYKEDGTLDSEIKDGAGWRVYDDDEKHVDYYLDGKITRDMSQYRSPSPMVIVARWPSGIPKETNRYSARGIYYEYFYENGQLDSKFLRPPDDNGFDGTVLGYHPSGKLAEESFWESGKILRGKTFTPDGKCDSEIINGDGTRMLYHDGKLQGWEEFGGGEFSRGAG